MLDKIKEIVFQKYSKEDYKGIFISVFGGDKKLLASNGVLTTNRGLEKTVDTLYYGLFENIGSISYVLIDVVLDTKHYEDVQLLKDLDIKKNGLCMISKDSSKSGVVLPDTKGIENIGVALKTIKSKNDLDGKVDIYSFTTDRFVVYS